MNPQSGIEHFARNSAFSSLFRITQCLRRHGCESGCAVILHAKKVMSVLQLKHCAMKTFRGLEMSGQIHAPSSFSPSFN